MKSWLFGLSSLGFSLLFCTPVAHAGVVFEISKLNDYTAIVSGGGVLDGPARAGLESEQFVGGCAHCNNGHIFVLEGVYGSLPVIGANGLVPIRDVTMSVGGVGPHYHVDFAASVNSNDPTDLNFRGDPALYFGSQDASGSDTFGFKVGDSVSGSFVIELPFPATFAAPGSSGLAIWGDYSTSQITVAGTWHVVSTIPIPEMLPAFFGGLLTLFKLGRRSRKAFERTCHRRPPVRNLTATYMRATVATSEEIDGCQRTRTLGTIAAFRK